MDRQFEVVAGSQVAELTPGLTGRWLVTTQGSCHVWDLDENTYMRIPGPHSLSGAMAYDGEPKRVSRVTRWPRVGEVFLVWYDDGPFLEQWRRSSTVRSIERLAETESGADEA